MNLKRSTYLIAVLLGLAIQQGYSQSFVQIGGTINEYTSITSILSADDNNVDSVEVVSTAGFSEGDTVMIYCVKGAAVGLDTTDSAYDPGVDAQQPRNTGKYTFLLIEEILGNTVILNATVNDEIKPMGPGEMAQLIRVPSYQNAEVTSLLTASDWNPVTGEGGVLTLFVGGILRLNADIDVSEAGFWGARVSSDPFEYGGDCSSADLVLYDTTFCGFSQVWSGLKGEGTTDTTFHGLAGIRGKASSINGGGGGNARFAGGGGGSNYSAGITGGNESAACGPGVAETGGAGGDFLSRDYYRNGNPLNNGNRIFFGGGGGTGVWMTGFNSTDGADGGGIVVIVADSIEGNDHWILADGGDLPFFPAATGAAGGGGGGGCIILDVNGYKGSLNLSAIGGDGGNTLGSDTTGMGGAGGGGIYWLSGTSQPGVTSDDSRGTNGIHVTSGWDPLEAPRFPFRLNNLQAPLRGFLFNPVPTEYTVCSDQDPDPIIAPVPKGGDNTYTYQWVDSTKISGDWNPIPGATGKDYDPGLLSDTTYFRRIVSSASLTDTSFRIAVYVHPAIEYNTIASPDTVCSGNAPALFESSQMTGGPPWISGGPTGGTFLFKWQEMEEGAGVYSDVTGWSEDSTFQSGGLTTSTDFRRIAAAGVCRDTSNALNVRVLQPLAGNVITPVSETTPFDTICFNTAPESISGPVPTGGETTDMRYQWLSSDDPLMMGSLVAGETGQAFQSAALTETTYFRRIVLSGNGDACRDTSAYVEVLNIPYIDAGSNVITADQTVCQGIEAAALSGSNPTGAYTGSYSFTWLSSTDQTTWVPAPGDPTVQTGYEPGIMGGPDTWYLRQVGWGGQELVCKDSSAAIRITVLDSITNNLLAPVADELCQGLMPENIVGQTPGGEATSRTYAWYKVEQENAPEEGDWGAPVASGTPVRDYLDPVQLVTDADRWYRRIVTSGPGGECVDTSAVFHLEVHSEITGNAIDTDQLVCYNDSRALRGFAPTGGESGLTPAYTWRTWQEGQDSTDAVDIAGSDQEAYVAGPFNTPGELTVYFDRVLEIGACRDTSGHMKVDIMQLPGGQLTVPDFDSCSGYLVDLDIQTNLNAGNPGNPAETASYPWFVTLKHGAETEIGPFILGSASLADPADILADVELNSDGASYVERLYEIESIFYYPEGDSYACAAPPANITGGPVSIGVFRTPTPQIMVDQVDRDFSYKVCDDVLILQIDDEDNGIGSWTFDPAQFISQQEVATDEYEVSIDSEVKSAYTVLGEAPYLAVYASRADATGCIGYDSIDLYFYEQPADFEARDTFLYVVNSVQMKVDPPTAGSGIWSTITGSGSPENDTLYNTHVNGLETGVNQFLWTVQNGEGEGLCSAVRDTADVTLFELKYYNGFSPNGDMSNEYFIMQGLTYADDFTLRIFNSLGNTVRTVTKAEAENLEVDESLVQNGLREDEMVVWDGRSDNGNLVPSGTYYFVISFIVYPSGENTNPAPLEYKDYVVVARE